MSGDDRAHAGWYQDPWGQAPYRWWDGSAWTAHTHWPPRAAEATSAFEALLAGCDRIAVIDVETTGLYNVDRVVEVAIVTVDKSGTVVDEFETLVNPCRDVGPTWLHQISASMVADAPTFDQVAHHVAARLDGAICAAHNLPFDRRMLANQLVEAGIDVHWGDGLDTLTVTGCKLGVACQEFGIDLVGAHGALVDARATAQLLMRVAERFDCPCAATTARPIEVVPMRVCTRKGRSQAQVPAPYLAALARGVHSTPDVATYVDLLDAAVADLRLTAAERAELAKLATDLGLDDARVARAHRDFINGLVDAAVEDAIVSESEYDKLCRAAALLEVSSDVIARRTDGLRAAGGQLVLTEGLKVCFTGAAVTSSGADLPRSDLERLATEHGLVPTDKVTAKGCDLLVAADPASRSGKAANARRHGVPVAGVGDFIASTQSGTPLGVTRLTSAGVALVCGECGQSWLAGRGSARPTCSECRATKLPPSRATAAKTAERPPAIETLTCEKCGSSWERERVRGRKPLRCLACES